LTTNKIIGALVNTQNQVDQLSRAGLHACGGTFTHSVSQAVTTAGTVLTFDTEIRNSGLTVDATNKIFTVNTGGMFMFSLAWNFSSAVGHGLYLRVNGVNTDIFVGQNTSTTYHSGIFMKYLQKNHNVSFFLASGANTNVTAVAEDSIAESPILQISQVSPKFTGS
jgi:hypothetical protein